MLGCVESSYVGAAGLRELDDPRFHAVAVKAFSLRRWIRTFDGVSVSRFQATATEIRNIGQQDRWDAMECVDVEAMAQSADPEQAPQPVPTRLVFAPTWGDHRAQLSAAATYLVIRVDRRALSGIVPTIPDTPRQVSMRGGLMTAVHAFAAATLESPGGPTAVERYATGQLLTEMVGAMMLDRFGFGLDPGADETSPSARLRDQAIAVIAQRRADPLLGVDEIAASVLVSPRRLQAAFADASTTVSAEIRGQRAALAVHLLTTSRFDVLGIDEVAREAGFGSTLSMRRALQDLHGTTPSRMRRRRGDRAE